MICECSRDFGRQVRCVQIAEVLVDDEKHVADEGRRILQVEELHDAFVVARRRVSGTDYEEVLIPVVDAALKRHKKLRLIYELESDITGFAPGAMWDDMKLGVGHLSAWEKSPSSPT